MSGIRKIVHLQSLRAIAASLVVAAHALEYPVRRDLLTENAYRVAWSLGWIGVAIFFVISGFIMIRSTRGDFGSARQAGDFLARRLLRVVPIYWMMVPLFAIAALARGETLTLEMVFKTLFFIPYFSADAGAMRPIVGQGWTLNFEMYFYFLFAAAMLFRRKLGVALLIGLLCLLVMMHALLWPLSPYQDPAGIWQFWTDPLLLLFLFGLMLGAAELRMSAWHALPYPVLTTSILILLAIVGFVVLDGRFPMSIGWQAVLAGIALLAVLACTSGQDQRLSALGHIVEVAGDASYSTYLCHPLVLMVLAALWNWPSWGYLPFLVCAVLLCNIAGYCQYQMLERPIGGWLRTWMDRRAVRSAIGQEALV